MFTLIPFEQCLKTLQQGVNAHKRTTNRAHQSEAWRKGDEARLRRIKQSCMVRVLNKWTITSFEGTRHKISGPVLPLIASRWGSGGLPRFCHQWYFWIFRKYHVWQNSNETNFQKPCQWTASILLSGSDWLLVTRYWSGECCHSTSAEYCVSLQCFLRSLSKGIQKRYAVQF